MKLIELHVADTTSCSPRHRDTIARCSVWITGVQVDLAGTPGREYHKPGGHRQYVAIVKIKNVCAMDLPTCETKPVGGDQVDSDISLKGSDILSAIDVGL